jgi:hypothetical protein
MSRKALNLYIPDSKVPRPAGLWKKAKYYFWKALYPPVIIGRDVLMSFHLIHHEGRQRFLFGKLASGKKVEDFLKFLEAKGFGNHFVAWKDDGQLISLRRPDGFDYQYHLRIFKDGEIRGHYEYTPESHPYWHFIEHGEEERRSDFFEFCGDWIVRA